MSKAEEIILFGEANGVEFMTYRGLTGEIVPSGRSYAAVSWAAMRLGRIARLLTMLPTFRDCARFRRTKGTRRRSGGAGVRRRGGCGSRIQNHAGAGRHARPRHPSRPDRCPAARTANHMSVVSRYAWLPALEGRAT